jgi:hypothetical protein
MKKQAHNFHNLNVDINGIPVMGWLEFLRLIVN